MKKRKNAIYANKVNLSGLYSSKPVKLTERDDECFWDRSGNFGVVKHEIGHYNDDGYIRFSSENEHEVQLWTDGAKAVMKMLAQWSNE